MVWGQRTFGGVVEPSFLPGIFAPEQKGNEKVYMRLH